MYGNLDKNFKFPKHLKSMLAGTNTPRGAWRVFMEAHVISERYRKEGGKRRDREDRGNGKETRSTTDSSSVAT